MSNGGVKLTIPAGWSAPSVSAVAAGYTTSSAGTVAVAGTGRDDLGDLRSRPDRP